MRQYILLSANGCLLISRVMLKSLEEQTGMVLLQFCAECEGKKALSD